MIGKVDEASFAAEQGLAKFDSKKTISLFLTELSTPIIFLAIEELTINIWLLRMEKKMTFRQGRLGSNRTEKYPVRVLLETAFERIGAEGYERREDRDFRVDNPFKSFYDAVIGPIVDLLRPEDDELVIVFNGELCLTPMGRSY